MNIGDIRALLAEYPDDTVVIMYGNDGAWYPVEGFADDVKVVPYDDGSKALKPVCPERCDGDVHGNVGLPCDWTPDARPALALMP